MRRFEILDGLRGYFLVFMLLHHLPLSAGVPLAGLHHGSLGYVQDAQGFVFLSGLVFAVAGTRLSHRGRADEVGARARARAAEIARHALGLVAALLTLALAVPASAAFWGPFLPDLHLAPATHGPLALLLLYQPSFLDILPQYILYLLAAPVLLRLILAGRGAAVAAGSLAAWGAVQLGWHLPLTSAVEQALGTVLPGAFLRGHFNPFAWQVLFVSGLLAGADAARGAPALGRWLEPGRTGPLRLALAVLLVFLLYRIGFALGWLEGPAAERFGAAANRTEFGPVFLLNFAALAYAVAWLVVAGPRSGSAAARRLAGWLRRLLEHSFLRLLGRHSLPVYAFHVVLVYAAAALEWAAGPLGPAAATALALAAVAALALPALRREERALALRPRGTAPGG
ncbi:MAG TPA: OpgC domain-containing protein [Azospirillaceae bacterium]|nr:OpgC domain-containing protein [Azospirillaceae bacterium]